MNCSDSELRDALEQMILSASGWRKIFAPDGEESLSPEPSAADCLLAVAMGLTWGQWLTDRFGRGSTVLTATDTRPTGPILVAMLTRGLRETGTRVTDCGAAAAPEVMARCALDDTIDAFAYVSASHNPVGYNGVKFGTGGVLGGTEARKLIESFRDTVTAPGAANHLRLVAESQQAAGTDREEKHRTLGFYFDFLNKTAAGPGRQSSENQTLKSLKSSIQNHPVTIVADLNGSARCVSADRMFLENLGCRLLTLNGEPGKIAHAILPEGAALEPCRAALKELNDPSAFLGYVPDNDGDRGNLVIRDELTGAVRILEAQEVFALSVLAELASAAWSLPDDQTPQAVVVNGPTSHRVRDIAKAFGAEVHETEVGEANVVDRAAQLRHGGYRVRIMGEGSNGGTIVHPAQVRDPLNTVAALLKLLRLFSAEGRPGPFGLWCRRRGLSEPDRFGPAQILSTLPAFTTTPVSSERAVMSVCSADHKGLKSRWLSLFRAEWERRGSELREKYHFDSWTVIYNEGTVSSSEPGSGRGGMKVLFRSRDGEDAGFLWMRGSGTEPVFRIMTEIRGGDVQAEKELTLWHRGMVAGADRLICGE